MSTLREEITSGDPQKIWASSCAIVKLRDARELDSLSAHLAEIAEKTAGIELGGALFPNREHLRFALRKLAYYRDKTGCLCGLYPDYPLYDPRQEEKAGNIRITQSNVIPTEWKTDYTAVCTLCGTTFHIEEGEYHYTWWGWQVRKF